ncbi:hypothetical protein HNP46_006577 [Pseudomonas nitritireducens]|uniref:Uncharacterized protein n=1 Tax=Pseudomonas nitroreducens TaxID=46680 RepID=A0A7W7KSE0_PSENT|nr:hypothetical protein [Pseudomonas nitritireducens]
MSADARFSMECLRQFGLTGIELRMSKLGQQRVMLRSNCGRASSLDMAQCCVEERQRVYFILSTPSRDYLKKPALKYAASVTMRVAEQQFCKRRAFSGFP